MRTLHYSNEDLFKVHPCHVFNDYSKPGGVLWVSPFNTDNGWRDFCRYQNYRLSGNIEYELHIDDSNLLVLSEEKDFDRLPMFTAKNYPLASFVDFEKIASFGVTGIWMTNSGLKIADSMSPSVLSIYSWDCESVCIFDSDIVKTWRRTGRFLFNKTKKIPHG